MQARRSGKSHVVVARKRILAEKRVHEQQQHETSSWNETRNQATPSIDVWELLPDDLVARICDMLDAPTLLQVRGVNQTFLRVCDWDRQCQALWRDKIHVCPDARRETNRQRAYQLSVTDAKTRNHLHREELVYNPETHTGAVWSFRFKEAAGVDWTRVDPWYSGGRPRQFVFLENGLVQQYIPAASNTADQAQTRMSTNSNDQLSQRAAAMIGEPVISQVNPAAESAVPTISNPQTHMTWRFLTRPMDLPTRPLGSYIRLTVGGRDVPTYAVRRSPTQNWGFVMESCWGLYASFDLPRKPMDDDYDDNRSMICQDGRRTMDDDNRSMICLDGRHNDRKRRRRRLRTILRRTEGGNILRIQDYDDSDSDDETTASTPRPTIIDDSVLAGIRELQDDSKMLITSEMQWREAFLYNVGARVLPEGDEATTEFDRAWGLT